MANYNDIRDVAADLQSGRGAQFERALSHIGRSDISEQLQKAENELDIARQNLNAERQYDDSSFAGMLAPVVEASEVTQARADKAQKTFVRVQTEAKAAAKNWLQCNGFKPDDGAPA